MEIIKKANEQILQILGKGKNVANPYRLSQYCVCIQVEEGILLFQVLTRELLLLSKEEFAKATDSEYMREHWCVVEQACQEREYTDLVRWVFQNMQRKESEITAYTILTTTDCNARCFYCYELGCKRIHMSEETAAKVVEYIKTHRNGKPVELNWFGGEPLVNYPVIDMICKELQRTEIPFQSKMISNAYLFDKEMVNRAKECWKLKSVQITLDGTEQIYNQSKAYIYQKGSAYQVVLANIESLLEAGISVVIRLNMGPHNVEDLTKLVEELETRFGGRKGIYAYVRLLMQEENAWNEQLTEQEWEQLNEAKNRLEDKMLHCGLQQSRHYKLDGELPKAHCMADSGKAVVILPDGHIGLCEHYLENEFIGHIDGGGLNQEVLFAWRERAEKQEECEQCFYYPQCVEIKKCPEYKPCTSNTRNNHLRELERAMKAEYEQWCEKNAADNKDKVEG
ncbi:MAG: radical SAM protein [Lachnospiraceae bacterium]|nr:radical SAM protein [Lachnospiraceae bacterium]